MATTYAETPDNYSEIEEFVVTDIDEIKSIFFKANQPIFGLAGVKSCHLH